MGTDSESSAERLSRRDFVGRLSAAAGIVAVLGDRAGAREDDGARVPIVDCNVSLFHWPFRRLPLDEVSALAAKMSEYGVESGWAGSFEGLLHRDVGAVNRRLADACARSGGRFLPFGTVNLSLPDWREDLRRCHEEHRMPGVRLNPSYHGYSLSQPDFPALLKDATERGMLVQLAVTLEDTRTQHPLGRVEDVDLAPLAEAVGAVPGARVMVLGAGRSVPAAVMKALAVTEGVYFDISRVENTRGVAAFVNAVSPGRALFGTHAPFLIYEAALIKVYEAELPAASAGRLLHGNARDLLRKR